MKNKGMTLIELLMVIVLIAIVALITIPVVGNIAESAKKQVAVTNTDKLVKTSIDYYETQTMGNENFSGLVLKCDGDNCVDQIDKSNKLSFSGEVPNGHLIVTEYGEIKQVDVMFGKYVCSMIDDKITCKKPDLVISDIDGFNTFLSNISNYEGKVVVLTSDLDYDGKEFIPSTGTFKGEFHGLGYTISNIEYTGSFHGIFYKNENAIVTSLNVKDSNFQLNTSINDIGIIAGTAENNSKVYNCSSINNTIINEKKTDGTAAYTHSQVGGIVGYLSNSVIEECIASNLKIMIDATNTQNLVNDSNNIGGIVGLANNDSKMYNNYVTDFYIKGYDNIGGIAGVVRNTVTITNCYSKNPILIGYSRSAGIAGVVFDGVKITNCYVENELSSADIKKKYLSIYGYDNATINSYIASNAKATTDAERLPIIAGNINVYLGYDGGIAGEFNASSVENTIENTYTKNLSFYEYNTETLLYPDHYDSTTGSLVGYVVSNASNKLNNSYALSIEPLTNQHIGQINNTTPTNTIIINHDNDIFYTSQGGIDSLSAFKNNLDNNWNVDDRKYPILYKLDKNGNPTSYLLGGQE